MDFLQDPKLKKPQDPYKMENQQKSIEDLRNIQASQEQGFKQQQGQLLSEAADIAGTMAQQGGQQGRQGLSSMFRQVAPKAGELLVQQKSEEDKLNFQGAIQEEEYLLMKQKAALEKYQRETANKEKEMALLTMKQAFDAGYDVKQLIYSNNGALADLAFKAMQEDFQNGRMTQEEARKIVEQSKLEVQKYQLEAEKAMEEIQQMFNKGITELNAREAKRRTIEYYEAMRKAQEAAARAANTAGILGGVFKLASMATGAVIGGAPGAMLGGAVSNAITSMFGGR